ncbi:MAG: LLM class F420-dependent oxidoreductase, partial [Sphingomonadales bacterium]
MGKSFEVGCFFPYSEIEVDPVRMRDFAVSVEAMGYHYLADADHVIGVNRASRPDWPGHYDVTERFYDPLMLFS